MDVDAWLEELGLEQYSQAFADQDIDGAVLRELTDGDLREIGVASLGHRKKLLAAIAALDTTPPAADESPPDEGDTGQAEGEYRQVTVLFADLTDFTGISETLGAEATHRLLNTFFDVVDGIIEGYGGTVDKHIGDNVMAVFGAPVAHTDDPERALRTAAAIHAAMPALGAEASRELSVHIGVASGAVVASGTGSDRHNEYTVIGDSVNLAARLQGLAAPGETLASDPVRRAAGAAVLAEPLAAAAIKGVAQPVQPWRITGMATAATGRAAGRAFVGRRGELAQIRSLLIACAESRTGQVVQIRGEPGIGKSRLVDEFQCLARDRDFACHASVVLDFGAGRRGDPIRDIVAGLFGIDPGVDEATARAALDGASVDDAERVALAALLDLPRTAAERILYEAMDNDTRVRGRRAALVALVGRAAAERPLFLRVEDIHWADAALRGDLATLARATADRPAVLVLVSRNEGDPIDQAWRAGTGGTPFTAIDLGPLRDDEATELAHHTLDAGEAFIRACVERAEGNALFLEQLILSGEEAGRNEIPDSIHRVVQARLDRLAAADKAAIQAAAVIGQRFTLDALRHVADDPSYDGAGLLRDVLVRQEDDDYRFAHAMIRDGAYAALLGDRRRALHLRAADWFAERDVELWAEHLGRAEDPRAPGAYLDAVESLAAEFRDQRALDLARSGLDLATTRADRHGLTLMSARLLQNLGAPRESITVYQQALDLASDDAERCAAWIGVAAGVRLLGGYDEGTAALDRAEALAGADDHRARAQIHHYRGNFFFSAAELERCLGEQEKALAHAERAGGLEWQARILGGLGDAYFARGRMGTAVDYFQRCLALCDAHGFGRIALANRLMVGVTRRYLNEFATAFDELGGALDMARQAGDRRALFYILNLVGEFHVEQGAPDQAIAPLEEALAVADTLGNRRVRPYAMCQLARARLAIGEAAAARALLEGAFTICAETDPRFIGARVMGVMALAAVDDAARQAALAEGERILARGCAAHNHLWFNRDAIEACLRGGDWAGAARHAARLIDETRAEPLPWSDFYAAWGRALAAHGSGEDVGDELARLHDQARKIGPAAALPLLDAALSLT